jgi:hypothetical protein
VPTAVAAPYAIAACWLSPAPAALALRCSIAREGPTSGVMPAAAARPPDAIRRSGVLTKSAERARIHSSRSSCDAARRVKSGRSRARRDPLSSFFAARSLPLLPLPATSTRVVRSTGSTAASSNGRIKRGAARCTSFCEWVQKMGKNGESACKRSRNRQSLDLQLTAQR